jgi:hypothetical protein
VVRFFFDDARDFAEQNYTKKEDGMRNIAIQKKLKWIFTLSADDSSTTDNQYDYNLQLRRLP